MVSGQGWKSSEFIYVTFSGEHLVGTTSGATTLAVTALSAKLVLMSLGKPDTESQEKRQRLGASPREKRLPSAGW